MSRHWVGCDRRNHVTTKKHLCSCETCAAPELAISDDEDFTFSAGSKVIRVFNRQCQERLLEGQQDDVTSLAPCPDLQTLVSGGKDGEIRLWNYQTGDH